MYMHLNYIYTYIVDFRRYFAHQPFLPVQDMCSTQRLDGDVASGILDVFLIKG